ncbi:HU family DNA-binding protein [Shewanella litorisediminis]|uniref:HU family DNA-binding protein n=1 Tax=Shewanella litorisediminis TaxID=1173586 RepID=A0ABX7G7W8_9GAMM|nr:HU family DNA-binding protein [Shewanella litorisediminis]MCL2919738.1 HU family DNA-binding protein [Shewanella litorisediminis]QRH03318.1 HU family DNA-binding protein [Shewanella litorisediminis]
MNKATLTKSIAKATGVSQSEAKRQLEQILASIRQALEEGETLYLPQFGTFELRYHLPRQVRNPKTREMMEVAGFNQPSFKPAPALKQLISGR